MQMSHLTSPLPAQQAPAASRPSGLSTEEILTRRTLPPWLFTSATALGGPRREMRSTVVPRLGQGVLRDQMAPQARVWVSPRMAQ